MTREGRIRQSNIYRFKCFVYHVKSSPDTFPIRNGLQKEKPYRHKVLNITLGDARRRVQLEGSQTLGFPI